MQHFLFPACWEKGTPQLTLKVNVTKGVYGPGTFKLGHLQVTKPIFHK